MFKFCPGCHQPIFSLLDLIELSVGMKARGVLTLDEERELLRRAVAQAAIEERARTLLGKRDR